MEALRGKLAHGLARIWNSLIEQGGMRRRPSMSQTQWRMIAALAEFDGTSPGRFDLLRGTHGTVAEEKRRPEVVNQSSYNVGRWRPYRLNQRNHRKAILGCNLGHSVLLRYCADQHPLEAATKRIDTR